MFFGEQNLIKYQEESTNVSNVSVSLIAGFPVFLCLVFFQVGWFLSGFPFWFKSTSLGNAIGSSSFSTGTTDPSSKYIIGIGQPQYLCLEIPQSLKRKDIFFCPIFFS